ncbi:MAG: glycosyltransferase [Acidobacteriota bacterium]
MSIPRVLHQSWKTEEIPERFRPWVQSVRRMHPDFEYRLWTDDDNERLIAERYPWFLETYRGYSHPVERADAARYFVIYTHGGVYLDLDMECLRPLDPLLLGEAVVLALEAGPRITQQVVSNALLAAPQEHPFFGDVIRALDRKPERDVTFQDIFDNTGPNFLERVWSSRRHLHDIRVLGLDEVCPRKVLAQNEALPSADLDVLRRGRALTLVHHNTETWNRQWPPPEDVPVGWTLHLDHDLPGADLEFVGADIDGAQALLAAAERVPGAVAVNFNGFAKGRSAARDGSPRAPTPVAPGSWLKPGIRPWVAVRSVDAQPARSGRAAKPRPPVTLLSYANRRFQAARDHCLATGARHAGFSEVRAAGPTDLDGDFVRRHLPILGQKRGAGLWLWKPYILLRALEELDGGWLFYADAGTEFLRSVGPVVEHAEALGTDVLWLGEGFTERQYTKRDALILLDADRPEITDSPQRFASHLLLRRSEVSLSWLRQALDAATDPRILTDQPNQLGASNAPDFIAHRHDQSILSVLGKKLGLPPAPPPREVPWIALGTGPDRGQILNHPRRAAPPVRR